MLTEEELTAIRDENELQKEMHVARWSCVRADSATIDRLLAEVHELRLVLRDAVQDSTPGNRVWREGVKAGLEAAAATLKEVGEGYYVVGERAESYRVAAEDIRTIDPTTILPAP